MPRPVISFKDLFLTFLSSVLLIFSFPRCDLWFLAWGALVPFFFLIDGKKRGNAFGAAYALGIIFFLGTLYWFIHVTFVGMILIALYLAIYFGFFGLGYSYFEKESLSKRIIILPSLWITLEYIRGHLMSGFGWLNLGHSQYKIIPLIQIADTTGVYGISFLVVMVNVLAPSRVRLLLIALLILSIAVRIPTSAMMPKEMISMVRIVRSRLARMERKA